MYLDISSNQGRIDWEEVAKNEDIKGVILRATTKNNKLDTRTIENYNAIMQHMSEQLDDVSVYKFAYAKDYIAARLECHKCIVALAEKGIKYKHFYLDLERTDTGDFTREQATAVIYGYMDELANFALNSKLRIYCNYNYLKNIIDPAFRSLPIWLARYNDEMGDTFGANVVLWQYTSRGQIDGINGAVDLSRVIRQ